MTPEEKAEELVNSFYKVTECKDVDEYCKSFMSYYHAKQCDLMCVEEILEEKKKRLRNPVTITTEGYEYNTFWQQVKQEIEKL